VQVQRNDAPFVGARVGWYLQNAMHANSGLAKQAAHADPHDAIPGSHDVDVKDPILSFFWAQLHVQKPAS